MNGFLSHENLLANQDCLGDEMIAYAEALDKTYFWPFYGHIQERHMDSLWRLGPRAVRFKLDDSVDNIRNLVSPDNY